MKRRYIAAAACIVLWAAIAGYKIFYLHYHPRMVVPVFAYRLELSMDVDGHGTDIRTQTFLPTADDHQEFRNLEVSSQDLRYEVSERGMNSLITWERSSLRGHRRFGYSGLVRIKEVLYHLPDSLSVAHYSPSDAWLSPTDLIQSDSPEIAALASRLGITQSENAVDIIKRAFHYAADSIASAGFSASTSALLAYRLREASCNGKSRLMVALLRHRGIPSRLVGGLILKNGRKRTTHQWLEAQLGDEWVPFCPLNRHFASIPDRYLALYRGDETMFERTANVNFKYRYDIKRTILARDNYTQVQKSSLVNILNLWNTFGLAGVSLEILRILLMIPLGSIVIIIFRNVIGIHTFGTFLPVLIATAYRGTGLLWGSLIFTAVILTGALVRGLLERFRLLHSPKLTIILVSVIATLIAITLAGIELGNKSLLGASMFPLAILAITVERFSLIADASGIRKAFHVFAWTLLVVAFCYIAMLSTLLQSVIMTFPETLLLVIAASFYLGGWSHLRLSELIRFRKIIFSGSGHL